MSRERPILFSGPMIRALLAGTKTQTRRVVKFDCREPNVLGHCLLPVLASMARPDLAVQFCPHGVVGDRLWVKETIQAEPWGGDYHEGAERVIFSTFVADGAYTKGDAWPWQRQKLTAIHCPRGLSRLTLEITDVRVQRLQDITEADARAEGITDGGCMTCGNPEPCGCANPDPDARDSYLWLWNSLNEKRGFGWITNPWVWAITFRRLP